MTGRPAGAGGERGLGARFTILSMMRDEGPYLLEWLAFHRAAGFDNVCVYTNDCRDGTDRMLARLEAMGLCRHFLNRVPEGKRPQPHALNLARRNPAVTETDWLIALDADEFLTVHAGAGRVADLVAALPGGAQAAAVQWRCFGSGGLRGWAPHLVTESYTRAAPPGFAKGLGVKTLFRPFPGLKLGIHRPYLKGRVGPVGALWVNGSGAALPPEFVAAGWRMPPGLAGDALAEVAHYAVKGREAYLLRRVRGNVNLKAGKYDAAYFAMFDRNEEARTTATRHGAALRALIGEWRTDAALARLEAEALAWHAARLAELRAAPGYGEEMAALDRAGAVPYERLGEVLYIHDMPRPFRNWVKAELARGVDERTMAETVARMVAEAQARRGML